MWMECSASTLCPISMIPLKFFGTRGRTTGYVRQRAFWMGTREYIGKQISVREVRPFVFAPIALTDDATKAVRDEAIIKGLGTIRLDFYRVTYEGTVANTTQYTDESKQHVSL